jgi:hypothetical protein
MKDLKVQDQHRTNELSFQPGGSEVKIVYDDGKSLVYDKIKNTGAYIRKATKDPSVVKIYVECDLKWERNRSQNSRSKGNSLF